jgi:hypothetical protein
MCFSPRVTSVLVALTIMISGQTPARCSDASRLPDPAGCIEIRESIRSLAKAERNQALALHLMAGGKPTPMVQTRFTELQAQIGELREVLRRARDDSSATDSYVSDCIGMGFQSLNDAENLSKKIQDIMNGENSSPAAQIKSDQPNVSQKLPEPVLPPGKRPEE